MPDLFWNLFWKDRGVEKGMGRVAGKQDQVAKKSREFSRAMKVGTAAAGAALFKFGKDSVAAFSEAEDAQVRLDDAFKRFPKIADTNQGRIEALSKAIQAKTKVDDESVQVGAATLAQFVRNGKQLESLIPLTADYARKTGKDMPTAAKTLGKAFLGNTRALKDLGINYKMTGDKTRDMANITRLLRERVGGFAEKEGTTAAGKMAILGNKFNDFQEIVGAKLLPALTTLVDVGFKVVGFIERNQGVLIPLAAALATVLVGIKLWTIYQALLNAQLFANPIGLVILAVAGLIAVIVLVIKNFDKVRAVARTAFGVITRVAQGAWNWFRSNWPTLLAILTGPIGLAVLAISRNWEKIKRGGQRLLQWFRGLPAAAGRAVAGIASSIFAPFRSAFNAIATMWNRTVGAISISIPSWVPKIGGNSFSVPDIPTMHGGGTVPGPRGANRLILAQGGEEVIPIGGGSGRGTTIIVHVNGVIATDVRQAARAIHAELINLKNSGRKLGLAD